jgi:hypothetical protein
MAIAVAPNPVNLAWANFRIVDSSPDLSGNEVAQIHPETQMPANIQVVNNQNLYRLAPFTIGVAPVQADTIVLRTAPQTADLLRHEQGHYDLLILTVRAMARDLEAATAGSAGALGSRVQAIQQTHATRAQALDAAYDTQTNHGADVQQQANWNTAIAAALGNPMANAINAMQL